MVFVLILKVLGSNTTFVPFTFIPLRIRYNISHILGLTLWTYILLLTISGLVLKLHALYYYKGKVADDDGSCSDDDTSSDVLPFLPARRLQCFNDSASVNGNKNQR